MKGDHIQASVPAPVASLPPRQPIPSVHFSMARSVHLSMAIDTWADSPGRYRGEADESHLNVALQ